MEYHWLYSELTKQFPDCQIFENHPLAPYTTLKIGGPADVFIDIKNPDQLLSILNFVYQKTNRLGAVNNFSEHSTPSETKDIEHRKNSLTSQLFLPITILGNGSNVLISDSGIRGLVVRYLDPLQSIIQKNLENGFVGLETFAYIPASLGGAIVSNIHGADKSNFNQYLDTITVFNLQTGLTETFKASDLKWDYDYSEFQDKPHLVILFATFNLKPGDAKAALDLYQQIISQKSQVQPMNSAGSVFKNPDDLPAKTAKLSAGKIIDDLGWKGKSVGDAKVYEKHANFIINAGNATANDFYTLMNNIQADVLSKKGIALEPEIKFLG